MIGISKLYCGLASPTDSLRYGPASSCAGEQANDQAGGLAGGADRQVSARPAKSSDRSTTALRPVVVWNCTRRCNLDCIHCYSASTTQPGRDELTGPQAEALIDDLAELCCCFPAESR